MRLEPEVLAGLDKTVQSDQDLGHDIVELPTLDLDYAHFIQAHTNIMAPNIVVSVETKLSVLQRSLRQGDLFWNQQRWNGSPGTNSMPARVHRLYSSCAG